MAVARAQIRLPESRPTPLRRLLVRMAVAVALVVFVTLLAFVERAARS